ncbi:metalloprotease 1 [Polychytrium aggregatum]|uniref:metalloprotease 1 n=1 Tax=Polychytrium aggregatum TaxID=110093 RepID=UPI0022FEE0BE|nr:metalloprotease 1 [Polychytrium aggregatum]KAI9202853.1 metalloprotease 1 [Polychytrium aggregatum]
MTIAQSLLFLLAASSMSAVSVDAFCGSHPQDAAAAMLANQRTQRYIEQNSLPKIFAATGNVNIDVYWHLGSNATATSNISNNDIQVAMNYMSAIYAKFTTFQFTVKGVDTFNNVSWFNPHVSTTNEEEYLLGEMKAALRKGGASTLNIYTVSEIALPGASDTNFLGLAAFPSDYAAHPGQDGVIMRASEVNKINSTTLAHEVGHWLGLYHTFQGGCSEPGDYVSDTPQQAAATDSSLCPLNQDTCPLDPGLDPVRNFMDYSMDSCQNNFTPGQIQRMQAQWNLFRADNRTQTQPSSTPTPRKSGAAATTVSALLIGTAILGALQFLAL